MNKELQKRVLQLLEEEQKAPVNETLLGILRTNASSPEREDWFAALRAEDRNAINRFVREAKDVFLQETLRGKFSADIVLEAILMLCLEAGVAGEDYLIAVAQGDMD